MSEYYVMARHLVVLLSDEEYIELKVQTAKANTKIKDWVSQAIREKLEKECK